jgi:hypothetical protein
MAVPQANHAGHVQDFSNHHGCGRTGGDDQRQITSSVLTVAVYAVVVRIPDEVLKELRFFVVCHRTVQRVKD